MSPEDPELSGGKLKILIVHNHYQIPGGEDTVVANEKRLLEQNGHEVILYTRDNSEINTMGLAGKLLLPFRSICNHRSARDVKRIIRDERIDIVHVHNTLNLISPSVYYAAVKSGVPVIQTIHNFRFVCPSAVLYRDGHLCEDCVRMGLGCAVRHGCYRNSRAQTLILVISALLHRATGILGKINYICLTEFNRDKLLTVNRKKQVIDPSRVWVKPNFSFFEQGGALPSEDSATQPYFIYVGRLDELKGIRTLFEAWRLMGADAPRLVVCGKGPLEEWCGQQARSLNIEMKGFVEHSEARRLIAQSDALLLPTLWYEGFPMTIAEAFSVGTPVICTDLGNAGSIVREGETGWKFPVGDAQGLADTVRKCGGARGLLRQTVRREYERKYAPEANYRILEEIYTEVCHADRSAGSQHR